MRFPQTKAIMEFLRSQSKKVRANNKRIDEWVDNYIDRCVGEGKPVNLLVQWCLSRSKENRYEKQGNRFMPTEKEQNLVGKVLPDILDVFKRNGMHVNLWITFNPAFTDRGRISDFIADAYVAMVTDLISSVSTLKDSVIVLRWEKEVIGCRSAPNEEMLTNFSRFVSDETFGAELERIKEKSVQYPVPVCTEEGFCEETRFKIACEAEEGRFLLSEESPFPNGDFILLPLESPEQYTLFNILAPGFSKRIAAVIPPYPWRI